MLCFPREDLIERANVGGAVCAPLVGCIGTADNSLWWSIDGCRSDMHVALNNDTESFFHGTLLNRRCRASSLSSRCRSKKSARTQGSWIMTYVAARSFPLPSRLVLCTPRPVPQEKEKRKKKKEEDEERKGKRKETQMPHFSLSGHLPFPLLSPRLWWRTWRLRLRWWRPTTPPPAPW